MTGCNLAFITFRSCPNPDVVTPIWEKHIRNKLGNTSSGSNNNIVVISTTAKKRKLDSGVGIGSSKRTRPGPPSLPGFLRQSSTSSSAASSPSSSSSSSPPASLTDAPAPRALTQELPPELKRFLTSFLKQNESPPLRRPNPPPPPPPKAPAPPPPAPKQLPPLPELLPKTPVKPALLGDLSSYTSSPPPQALVANASGGTAAITCSVVVSAARPQDDLTLDSGGCSSGSESGGDLLISGLVKEDALIDPSEDPCLSEGAAAFALDEDPDDFDVGAVRASWICDDSDDDGANFR